MNQPAIKRPIRVCFYVFFPAGGIGRYTKELAAAFNGISDVDVELVCNPEFEWQAESTFRVHPKLKSISHPIAAVRKMRFLTGQLSNPLIGIRHATKSKADIIHFSNVNQLSFPYWKRALKRSNLRVAITVHDVKRRKGIVSYQWEAKQLRAIYRFADALFVHSDYQASELRTFAGVDADKIHVVPHGPYKHGPCSKSRDSLRAERGFTSSEEIALVFGNIRDDKNLDRFLKAVARSETKRRVVVAGRAESRHKGVDFYRRLTERLGLGDRVTFEDRYIPDEEVADLFTLADWVALPYRNSFTSQSGVLNVAAHYERPVLVSTSPVLKETVSQCRIGRVAVGDTVEAIQVGIDEISRDLERGEKFDFDAYRSRYSWAKNTDASRRVYYQLVGGSLVDGRL